MAVLLGAPDDARARSSTLIKSDEDYKTVFNSDYPVEMYLASVALMKRAEFFLRSKAYLPKEVNNLKFHTSMFVARRALDRLNLTASDVVRLSTISIDDSFFESCYLDVRTIYDKLGADDQAAKGPEFVKKLQERLEQVTKRRRLKTQAEGPGNG